MVGRPQTTRAIPKRLRRFCAAVCSRASVSPAQMRATRDLLRRRMPLAPTRAELLAHVHNTHSQYHLPAIGKKIAYKANREALPHALPIQRCKKVSQSIWRSSPPMPSGFATWHSPPSSQPPTTMTPTPGICCKPCPVSARFSASCCSTTSTRSTASQGTRCPLLLPPGEMSQGIGRQTPGDLRGHNRQRPSHGAFSEAAVLFLRDHPAAQRPPPAWKNMPRARPSLHPGPAAGPCRLL